MVPFNLGKSTLRCHDAEMRTRNRPYSQRPGNQTRPAFRHCVGPEIISEPTDPHRRSRTLAIIEAALMLADEPLTLRKLTDIVPTQSPKQLQAALNELRDLYDATNSSFQIEELAGGYQLLTRSHYHHWLLRLRRSGHELRLTPTAMETLAIIAYKQPIMRAEIDSIRGVQSSEMIRLLMERGLVRITGRHASLGRPQLYGTTKTFLQAFGLANIKDLPTVDAFEASE